MNVDFRKKKNDESRIRIKTMIASRSWSRGSSSESCSAFNCLEWRMAAPRLDVTSTHRESGKDGKKTNVFRFYFCPLERSRISDVAWCTPVLVPFDARTVSSFEIENSL